MRDQLSRFSKTCGEVLRNARREGGLTLLDVSRHSKGAFKPSSLGGYERGERTITLERFCDLASVYGTPPDRLLAEVMSRMEPGTRAEVVIDLNRLSAIEGDEALAVAEFVHNIRTQREDYLSSVITLRAGDLEVLSFSTHSEPKAIIKNLRPALREVTTGSTPPRGR